MGICMISKRGLWLKNHLLIINSYDFPPFIKDVSEKSSLVNFPINEWQEALILTFYLAF